MRVFPLPTLIPSVQPVGESFSRNAELAARDLAVLWHPCTQMKDHEQLPLIPIKRGRRVAGRLRRQRYLDAVSSWWVNVFGHANPRINQRIKDQVDQLEHVILAGFSHQPVIELSERLVKMTPEGLTRCFYADNGSSCIEVALKMSFHYWLNRGQPNKKRFVTLTNSYHGETMARCRWATCRCSRRPTRRCCWTPSRCRARIATCARA